mmetsp:Transcript_13079/g.19958  ORF Transcript_13079/g.19958 Transcript_13079/m.19958 type:complete len:111 (+) Transcript_13079:828-1160(+)
MVRRNYQDNSQYRNSVLVHLLLCRIPNELFCLLRNFYSDINDGNLYGKSPGLFSRESTVGNSHVPARYSTAILFFRRLSILIFNPKLASMDSLALWVVVRDGIDFNLRIK